MSDTDPTPPAESPNESGADPSSNPASPPAATPEELKLALKAFHKRLRLTRLDDESKLGHGAMTGGGKSGIVAIRPPHQIPKAILDQLVKNGKLKYVGQGLYESLAGPNG